MCEKVGSKEVWCGVENVKLDGFPLKRIVADVFLYFHRCQLAVLYDPT